jgi:hypothetical protein
VDDALYPFAFYRNLLLVWRSDRLISDDLVHTS